jgi:hypothetical protein
MVRATATRGKRPGRSASFPAGGQIKLAYADGSGKVESFAVDTENGVPDPVGEGVFLGDTTFCPDPSPEPNPRIPVIRGAFLRAPRPVCDHSAPVPRVPRDAARRGGESMATRLKAVLPLTVSIGLLAFIASEIALNFTFHWVTVQDGVFGKYGLPQSLHLVLPALFVSWGLFFLLGADRPALGKTVIAAATGSLFAGIAMFAGPLFAESPDFWGLALWIGITAAGLIVLSTVFEDDRFAPAPAFCCYASVFFWWIATGLDNFVPDGKGPHTAAAVTSAITDTPLAAGTGAFGGLVSMSWAAVVVSIFFSLVVGSLFGLLSVKLSGQLAKMTASRAAEPKVAVNA